MFGMPDCFDDESIISRKVKERARFAWRAQLGKNVFGSKGEKIIGWIKVEYVLA